MENIDILTAIKTKDSEGITEFLQEKGKFKTLSLFAQVLDKRAYVTIDIMGNIKRKNGNMVLPIFGLLDDNKVLVNSIMSDADVKERQIINKIERFSDADIEKVKENLMKTMFSGNYDFAKKYGKELFMRDREAFYNLLGTFVTLGNSDSLKGLYLIAFEKLMKDHDYDGNIFHLFMAYVTKFRDNTSDYEKSYSGKYTVEDLKKALISKNETLYSTMGLGILSNLYIIQNFNIPNAEKILGKLAFEIENYQNPVPLSDEQRQILEIFL